MVGENIPKHMKLKAHLAALDGSGCHDPTLQTSIALEEKIEDSSPEWIYDNEYLENLAKKRYESNQEKRKKKSRLETKAQQKAIMINPMNREFKDYLRKLDDRDIEDICFAVSYTKLPKQIIEEIDPLYSLSLLKGLGKYLGNHNMPDNPILYTINKQKIKLDDLRKQSTPEILKTFLYNGLTIMKEFANLDNLDQQINNIPKKYLDAAKAPLTKEKVYDEQHRKDVMENSASDLTPEKMRKSFIDKIESYLLIKY